jgi:hypothetical protein
LVVVVSVLSALIALTLSSGLVLASGGDGGDGSVRERLLVQTDTFAQRNKAITITFAGLSALLGLVLIALRCCRDNNVAPLAALEDSPRYAVHRLSITVKHCNNTVTTL